MANQSKMQQNSSIKKKEILKTVKINEWSQTYFEGLPSYQHKANNEWINKMTDISNNVVVPNLGMKIFTKTNNKIEEISSWKEEKKCNIDDIAPL